MKVTSWLALSTLIILNNHRKAITKRYILSTSIYVYIYWNGFKHFDDFVADFLLIKGQMMVIRYPWTLDSIRMWSSPLWPPTLLYTGCLHDHALKLETRLLSPLTASSSSSSSVSTLTLATIQLRNRILLVAASTCYNNQIFIGTYSISLCP